RVFVAAGEYGVALFDPVPMPVPDQELDRAVDRDRRPPRPGLRKPIHQLVGAERLMARCQDLEHLAAQWRQARLACRAERLGVRQGPRAAMAMIVLGPREAPQRSGA